MEPKFVEKDEFKVVGYALRTNPIDNKNLGTIPAFWDNYIQNKLYETLPAGINPNVELGLCTNCDEKGNFDYIICREVENFDNIPAGAVSLTIPKSTYAVFTAIGKNMPKSIGEAFNFAFNEWLPKSEFEYNGIADFELYDMERMEIDEPEVDVYIPISKKED